MSSMSFLWEGGVFLRTCMLSEVWEKFNCKFGLTCKFADPRIDWDRNFNFWISHHCDLESGFLISKEELLCQSKVSAPQKVLLGGKCIKIFRKIEIYSCNALFTPAKLQKRWNLPLQVPELLQMPWLGKSSMIFFVKRIILSKKLFLSTKTGTW